MEQRNTLLLMKMNNVREVIAGKNIADIYVINFVGQKETNIRTMIAYEVTKQIKR